MITLFCGHDQREALGHHVFVESVLERASTVVSIHALTSRGMPTGSNAFTFSRFLVPWLMGFKGHAIFCDAADMVMLGDIAELDAMFDPSYAVQVVKRPDYKTKHPIKYFGTAMQCPNRDYARKNWASVMLMNCEHPYWRPLDPQTLSSVAGLSLLQFGGLQLEDRGDKKAEVGSLPREWNVILDEGDSAEGAKLLHWTAGIPAFPHYANAPCSDIWNAERNRMVEVA